MIGRTNAGGSGGLAKSTLVVQTDTGATVTVTKGAEMKTAREKYGLWSFPGLAPGEWTIRGENAEGLVQTKTVTMDGEGSQTVMLRFNYIPSFTYTGDYKIVNDNDNEILTSLDNWKIRLLTSGKLTFTELRGAEDGIDVFLVGGGGGGASNEGGGNGGGGSGGGGYTTTARGLSIEAGIAYEIAVGAGGVSGSDGGNSSAFAQQANGGHRGITYSRTNNTGNYADGGSGGSGGGSGPYGEGGVDGADGTDGGKGSAGKGQGATTREFGEKTGTLYSNGGTCSEGAPSPMGDNTGNGGSGRPWNTNGPGGTGGSGIIIIRNRREEAA